MRKLIFIGITFFSLISFNLMAGTEIQNGGSGLIINGQVATFYSAKVKIFPDPIDDMDALDNLKTEVRNMAIDPWAKVYLSKMIMPSFGRKYYRVDPESISSEDIEAVKKEYQKITGMESKDIALFALTNIETQTTLLFPDFFKLSPNEKMAILFHESMWLSNMITSYQDIVQLEYSFQQYLEVRDLKSTVNFYQHLSSALDFFPNWLPCTVISLESNEYLKNTPTASNVSLSLLMNEDSIKYLSQIFIATIKQENNDISSARIQLMLNLQSDISKSDPFYFSKNVFLDYVGKTGLSGRVVLSNPLDSIFKDSQRGKTLVNALLEKKLLGAHFVSEQSNKDCPITLYDSKNVSIGFLK